MFYQITMNSFTYLLLNYCGKVPELCYFHLLRVHSELQTKNSSTFRVIFKHQEYQYEITLYKRNQSHNIKLTSSTIKNFSSMLWTLPPLGGIVIRHVC